MVNWFAHPLFADVWFLAQEKSQSVLQRMRPEQRAKVLAAFAAFVILFFGLIALAWLGARVTRRYMNQEPLRLRDPLRDDWADKPLVPPQSKSLSDRDDEE